MSRRSSRIRHDDDRDETGPDGPVRHAVGRTTDPAVESIVRQAADPEAVSSGLVTADEATRTRALEQLQRTRGNRYVQQIVAGIVGGPAARAAAGLPGEVTRRTVHAEFSASGAGAAVLGVQREEEDLPGEDFGPEPFDTTEAVAAGATETIGPETSSTYDVGGTTLAEVADVIGARPEAGHVGWALNLDYAAPKGVIDSVSITADITLEMPSWTPPPKMLPKAKAEWSRWHAALLAHESGHIQLVHDVFDGLAAKLMGKTPGKGKSMFNAAKAKLAAESAAYDKRTKHGKATGTVMDVSIEDKEIEDKKKADEKAKEDEKKKAEGGPGKEGAAPGEAKP